jgi:anthranilate phosphoribosyltransferase
MREWTRTSATDKALRRIRTCGPTVHPPGEHHSLSAGEAASAMVAIVEGNATPARVSGLLMALRPKGEAILRIATVGGRLAVDHRLRRPHERTDPVASRR